MSSECECVCEVDDVKSTIKFRCIILVVDFLFDIVFLIVSVTSIMYVVRDQ
jgi:hypothetical protein